jgi:hypothetical protein
MESISSALGALGLAGLNVMPEPTDQGAISIHADSSRYAEGMDIGRDLLSCPSLTDIFN